MALLDDVAGIAKMAAASIDDVGAAAGKAATKATGVVVDDAAVTPKYVMGLSPSRELPIIWRIAKGSFRNTGSMVGGSSTDRSTTSSGSANPTSRSSSAGRTSPGRAHGTGRPAQC